MAQQHYSTKRPYGWAKDILLALDAAPHASTSDELAHTIRFPDWLAPLPWYSEHGRHGTRQAFYQAVYRLTQTGLVERQGRKGTQDVRFALTEAGRALVQTLYDHHPRKDGV